MGNHRAERRGPRSRPSEAAPGPGSDSYAGRRVAGRPVPTAPLVTHVATTTLDVEVVAEVVTVPDPEVAAVRQSRRQPGRRKAVKHAGSRGPLFKGLPSAPVLVGLAALAVSAGGAVAAGDADLAAAPQVAQSTQLAQAGALSGASAVSRVAAIADRGQIISRDSRRDALEDAADAELVAAAEKQNRQRNAALAQFARQAEQQAAKIELNQWVLPLSSYRLTATYGQYGLWSSYHTGLDFAAPTGATIMSVANGVVTETGYDGAYGNKTVVTLEDGTEIWYCHQTSITVSPGDVVRAGEAIGSVGSTGNVTGPHLHLEVRPGGGDPVDPAEALAVHGVAP